MVPCNSASSLDGFANISNNQSNLEMYLHEAPCKKLLMESYKFLSEELLVISISFLEEDRN